MVKYKFIFWLNKRPSEQDLDKAYDDGLTDPGYVYKGGRVFLEFNREGLKN